jgi:hypothetical protein
MSLRWLLAPYKPTTGAIQDRYSQHYICSIMSDVDSQQSTSSKPGAYHNLITHSSSVIYQTTGPKPLPKRFLHLMRNKSLWSTRSGFVWTTMNRLCAWTQVKQRRVLSLPCQTTMLHLSCVLICTTWPAFVNIKSPQPYVRCQLIWPFVRAVLYSIERTHLIASEDPSGNVYSRSAAHKYRPPVNATRGVIAVFKRTPTGHTQQSRELFIWDPF